MVRTIALMIFAVAGAFASASAHAKSPPSPQEVMATWENYHSDSTHSYYREAAVVREATNATLWKVSVPNASISALGVPIIYSQVSYDCVGIRKKIVAIKRFKADGSIVPPPTDDVRLDRWFPISSGDDLTLQREVCSQT